MKLITHRTTRVVPRVLVCVAIAVLAVACSDKQDSSSSTDRTTTTESLSSAGTSTTPGGTTASGDLCADRDALRSSVDDLKSLDVVAEGTSGLESAVGKVKDDLSSLSSAAGDELKPEVDDVKKSVDDLETAVSQLGSGGAAGVPTAISDLQKSTSTLLDSLESGACGSSTTAP